nr:MAG TPA: phosphoadenosine-phosphosulfate reductase [Caudoviricetes sp.]
MEEVEFYLEDLESKFSKIDPTKYVLSYSGGRDSHFLYWFIKERLKEPRIKIVGVNTTMEHPEILQRIKDNCDVVLRPVKKPRDVKKEFGSPCFSKSKDEFIYRYQNGSRSLNTMKYIDGINPIFKLNNKERELVKNGQLHKVSNKCCSYLKKMPLKQYAKENGVKYIIGVRGAESRMRKAQYTSCFNKEMNFTPIHDLTDELLDQIYDKYKIEVPAVYNTLKRTGCMGCPYGRRIKQELSTLNDNQYKYVVDLFKESYEAKGIDYEVYSENNSITQLSLFEDGI